MKKFKSGYVTVIGKPNVGKSTLINRYLGEKISIISYHPQTTRNKILAILTKENFQIVFIDTPGIHEPKHLLGKYMVNEAKSTLKEVDIIVMMLDASTGIELEDRTIFELVSHHKKKKILVVNKIDLVNKTELLPLLEASSKLGNFEEYIPISASKGDNAELLLQKIISYLPFGPSYYPEDQLTDRTERFHTAELIREKILENVWKEVPYSVAVVVDEFKEIEGKDLIHIKAIIYVERESQKGILIGEKGRMLKKIGIESRQEIEKFLDKKVYLQLWVKVYEKWRRDNIALRRLGYV